VLTSVLRFVKIEGNKKTNEYLDFNSKSPNELIKERPEKKIPEKKIPEEKIPEENSHESDATKKLIHKLNTELIPQWSQKYNLPKSATALIKMGVPFLDDHWGPRILAAMGNEVAEALKPSMKELGVPKMISSIIYYGSWAVALGSCSARALLRSAGEGTYKSLVKSAGQDLVAAIGGPTLIVLAANWIQNQIYDRVASLPSAFKSLVRPAISLFCSYLTIPKILDPIGIKFGNWITSFLPGDKL
jgi:hypothetical protein